jgi:hypothetical protein
MESFEDFFLRRFGEEMGAVARKVQEYANEQGLAIGQSLTKEWFDKHPDYPVEPEQLVSLALAISAKTKEIIAKCSKTTSQSVGEAQN